MKPSAEKTDAPGWRLPLLLLLAFGGVLGLCLALYQREVGQIEQRLYDRELVRVGLLARFAQGDLRAVADDLRVLVDGDGLRAYLESGQPADLERMFRRAVFFSRQQADYDQVRYLDERGREVVRVNHGGQIVLRDKLQDKSDRAYFKKTNTLAAGQIYVSAFDLNVENGRVEQPPKPMLRFAMPVFDAAGRRRGIYIINYSGSALLNRLKEAVLASGHRLRVLNPQGYWLKAADPAQEWGFMSPDRIGMTVARTAPDLWSRLGREPAGQARFGGGLFTWQRIEPRRFASDEPATVVADEAFLIVASEVSAAEWEERFSSVRQIFLILTPGLLLLTASSGWFFRARQRTRERLRRSEESLAVTLHSIGDAVLATDTEGKITRINRVAEELTGWSQAEAIGRPIGEVFRIINEQTRAPGIIPVADVLATGRIHGLANHTLLIARDGTERAIADSAAPIRTRNGIIAGVVLVFRDVSVERAAELKLAAALDELARFFTLSLDFLCISSADGYFKRVSPAVTDILGWTVEEFLTQPYIAFVHPDDQAATIAEVQRQVIGGEKVLQFENRYRHRDGSWRLLSWRSVPQPGGLMYATARDVTERRRAEEEIRGLHAELQQHAGRLEQVNQELESFSHSVSHDLRAPLRHIQGYVEMLETEYGASFSDEGRRYVKTITEAARNMSQLIDELLLFSRMGRLEMHEAVVDPAQLIREVHKYLEVVTRDRPIDWQVAVLPRVRGDAVMLRQVFANLLDNAVKYSRGRNPAVIEVGCAGEEEGRTIFYVRDNGAGFDMKYADKLFGVFQRLHRADEFEGTGIGLANVHRIITRHGGRIWAESRLGAGTTFYFTLTTAAPGETPANPDLP